MSACAYNARHAMHVIFMHFLLLTVRKYDFIIMFYSLCLQLGKHAKNSCILHVGAVS